MPQRMGPGQGDAISPMYGGPPILPNMATPMPPAAAAAATTDMAGLFQAFRRRWILAVSGGLVLAVVAGIAVFQSSPSKYTAQALLHVAAKPPKVIFETKEDETPYAMYQRTQATLLKSRKVLSSALASPEVMALGIVNNHPDPVGWLDRDLRADFASGSEILFVSLKGDDPHELPVIVNAVVDSYLDQIVEEEHRERLARYDRLKSLFQKMQDKLKGDRKTLRSEVETVGLTDKQSLAVKQQLAANQVAVARNELDRVQFEVRRAEAEVRLIEESIEAAQQEVAAPEISIEQDPRIVAIRERLRDLNGRMAQARRTARNPHDPSIQGIESQIRSQLAALNQTQAAVVRESRERPARQASAPNGTLHQAALRLEMLKSHETQLTAQIEAIEGQTKSDNINYLDMNWLEEEINLTTQASRMVGSEVEALSIELQANQRIRLIEKAELPAIVDPLRRYKLGGGAAIGALGLFVGLVTLLEYRSRKISSVEDLSSGLGIRLVGTLPPLRTRRKDSSRWTSMLVESVDMMRTVILHASRQETIRSVLVVGAGKGECKTSVACHLAASLARAGRRTLLIDCDLRNPSIHRALDLIDGVGVCEILRGESTWNQAILRDAAAGLDFLPAGRGDTEAIQRLAGDRLEHLFRELEAHYDFLVIDSAPILLVPDTLMISQHVDTTVFSVRNDVSRIPMVQVAYERLTSLGVRVLGAVMVGVDQKSIAGPYYGYSRGYGSIEASDEEPDHD